MVDSDLYIMEDVFTDECFLVFSPGISRILTEKSISLVFSLYSCNGECWQSYGPISAYSSFEADDIFFLASEMDSRIVDADDVLYNIDQNPVPYMMLISGAEMRPVYSGEDRAVNVQSEIRADMPDLDLIKISK
jgi:hypothetical protein